MDRGRGRTVSDCSISAWSWANSDLTEFLILRSFEASEEPEAEMISGKTKLAERFNRLFPHQARSVVVIELSDIATRLKELFDLVPPKRRGRSATQSSK